jgi:hypothetical protein
MARVSIYVPVDLKARMDRVRDATNWSEVVRPAILSAVTSHEHRKGAKMNDVVERLKASKKKYLLETAKEQGRLWASKKAEYVELRRVVDLAGADDKEALESLKSAIDPQNKLDTIEFADLMGVEERDMSNEHAVAFVEGTAEVYDQVADQLQEVSPGQSDDVASLLLAAEHHRTPASPDQAHQRKRR